MARYSSLKIFLKLIQDNFIFVEGKLNQGPKF